MLNALPFPPLTSRINLITLDEEQAKLKTRMPYICVGRSFETQEGWKYFLIKTKKGLSKLELIKSKKGVTLKEEDLRGLIRLPIRPVQTFEKDHKNKNTPELWKIKLEKSIASKPAINKNNIYLTGKYGSIVSLDINGKKLWELETNGTIYSSPKVEKDLVVIATNEGDLFTINVNNGNVFQVIGIGETITSDIELVDIEHNGMKTKGICFGTAEGNFYCYELYSLELIWWNNGVKEIINSSVATVKGKVLFHDKKGTLYCLSTNNGALLWKWEVQSLNFNPLFKSDIIIKDNNIYLIDADGDLHCIDALLGTKKWSKRKIEATGKIELDDKKNEIVLHSAKNKLLTVSLTERKVIKEIILPGTTKNEIATDIFLANKNIYVGFTDGSVFEIRENFRIIFEGNAPIVSINEMNGNILVTDYDGNLTLLDISKDKK
jgi:hypothetical protein